MSCSTGHGRRIEQHKKINYNNDGTFYLLKCKKIKLKLHASTYVHLFRSKEIKLKHYTSTSIQIQILLNKKHHIMHIKYKYWMHNRKMITKTRRLLFMNITKLTIPSRILIINPGINLLSLHNMICTHKCMSISKNVLV